MLNYLNWTTLVISHEQAGVSNQRLVIAASNRNSSLHFGRKTKIKYIHIPFFCTTWRFRNFSLLFGRGGYNLFFVQKPGSLTCQEISSQPGTELVLLGSEVVFCFQMSKKLKVSVLCLRHRSSSLSCWESCFKQTKIKVTKCFRCYRDWLVVRVHPTSREQGRRWG